MNKNNRKLKRCLDIATTFLTTRKTYFIPVATLKAKYPISERTLQRDIADLAQAGFVITTIKTDGIWKYVKL